MFVVLPVVMFVLPALAGHPVMPGDDFIQNFPLRVLAGSELRRGHLPLFDPYIWSGAPLLGGWNAGAAYPLTFLFAVLPGVAAWTINMTVTWWVAGLGTFAFLRASRLSAVASFLGALSFAFAGAMTAQLSHFGLVAGMSWVPVALLAALRLSERGDKRQRLAWISALAAAIAMVILAGEPRAIDDAVIIIASYAGWRAWRLGRRRERSAFLVAVLSGVALGVAIGALQWVPGIETVSTSQRGAHSAFLFDSGSLSPNRLLLSLVPDLLGGSGSFGQPAFLGTYSLNEMTGYVGLMPLVAAFALLVQLRWGRLPEWIIWHVVALVGVLLALGGNTPLGHVLVHLPFFGSQRLQSRNLVIADLALAILLAYWADRWLGESRKPKGARATGRRLFAAVPGIAVAGVVGVALTWGVGMWRWLGLRAAKAVAAGALRPWLVPYLVLGCLTVALVWWGPRLQPARRMRVLVCFVAADITMFTLLAVLLVAPGLGRHATPPTGAAMTTAAPRLRPVRVFTHGGRFAVYDPALIHGDELFDLGAAPDLNVMSKTPSVEGYSAIVDGTYATATGSHQAWGQGQDVLDPRVIGDGTLDQLGTTVLLTPAAYLITSADNASAGPRREPGSRNLAPRQSATWYFGSLLAVTSVTIPVDGVRGSAGRGALGGGGRGAPGAGGRGAPGAGGRGVSVGLVRPSGSVDWIPVASATDHRLAASLARPQAAVAVRVVAKSGRASLGPPVIGTAGARYRADGQLQAALVPPRWRFGGFDGAFAVFSDSMAMRPLTLRAGPHGTTAGASIRSTAGPAFAPTSARVTSTRGVVIIRAVADIPGWTASWRPDGAKAVNVLPIRRSGLVQGVTVPAGDGTITWTYSPPGARVGLWVSVVALGVLVGASVTASWPVGGGRNVADLPANVTWSLRSAPTLGETCQDGRPDSKDGLADQSPRAR